MDIQDKYSQGHENYRNHGMKEGNPGNIDPEEIDNVAPSKIISETETLQRNESALGINQSLKASAENLDLETSQIDDETRQMQADKNQSQSMEQTMRKEFDTSDFNRVDERDQHDSSEDWDAEQNRTGRHK